MTISELAAQTGFQVLSEGEAPDTQISGVFCCDLLSVCMSHLNAANAWVTVMGNVNAPYPYATENHQEYNARVLANVGAAKIILDKELTKDNLNKTINQIISDRETLIQMSQKTEQVSIKNVEQKIYEEINKII